MAATKWFFLEMDHNGDKDFNFKAFFSEPMDAEDQEGVQWPKLGPVGSDRLTQRWKYGREWVPFFVTASPMHASKWVVNRYFENGMLLEKGAGNAMDGSSVMLVRLPEETPTTVVQVHRDFLPQGKVPTFLRKCAVES